MSEDFVEKRIHARHRVFKGGRLAFNGGGSVECTVRNISPGGARVDVTSPIALPAQLTLFIDTDHLRRRCHPVWTHNTHIGVAFD
ncbi:PilZ domain-containing protein [Bradyrhizobium sp. Tv2a-2]|uniref:PilZ domain-containing protein n=1 Tax=Bradyrhizobium sp. Tv2a-2 TaxID=113395 RepID=UPI000412BD7C|nr:PilZ domain-containing protein [Bradyrhizobium sp. Tv2a-2]